MSKCYSLVGPGQAGSGPNTGVAVVATTAIRPMVNEIDFANSTTPADQTVQFCATKQTTAGTPGSTPTPNPLDPGDVASVSTGAITYSGEPTASFDFLNIYLNQRASFRWVAQDGRELVSSATASNGVGARIKTASASQTGQYTLMFRE